MNIICAVFFSLFIVLPTNAKASECENCGEEGQLIIEDYGPVPPGYQLPPIEGLKKSLEWLYELIMPAKYLDPAYRSEGEKSFYPHAKDSLKDFPHPQDVNPQKLPKSLPHKITGSITYVGLFPKKYKYDLEMTAQGLKIEVRVHLKDGTPADINKFTALMVQAEDLWNQSRKDYGFNYFFKFKIVDETDDPHFSVRVKDNTRGPYDTEWSRGWIGKTIAHELGHMLGLGDEYETLSSKMNCIRSSLMCDSYSGELMEHHYYFILRRLFVN